MFTGIVEEVGRVERINVSGESTVIVISGEKVLKGTAVGDSISVNGVCLTVTSVSGGGFTADIMNETVKRSSLLELRSGSKVNLERAMAADGRFGGHIVSGHIDGTGRIAHVTKDGNAVLFTVSAGENMMKYIIEKGSVALDGISLTVSAVFKDSFTVSVIPHTMGNTCLLDKKAGSTVNIENDCIGKYVEKLLFNTRGRGDTGVGDYKDVYEESVDNITEEFLIKNGF